MGEQLKIFGGAVTGVITGVFEPVSTPTHLPSEIFYRSPWEKENNNWSNFSYATYISTLAPVEQKLFDEKITALYAKQQLNLSGEKLSRYVQAADSDRYFTEQLNELHTNPKSGGGNITTIKVLLLLAAALLIAGAINFSNLSLASSLDRLKEIGVRKVMGASKADIFRQYFFSVAIQCLISLGTAALLVALIIPLFKQEFNVQLNLFDYSDTGFYIQLVIVLAVVAVLSGVYPSVVLSRFNAAEVIKGKPGTNGKTNGSNLLVILQFVLSAFFIIGSIVIYKQVSFLQSSDKGFKADQVLRIEATQKTREQHFETTREKLLSIPGVLAVSKSTTVPGDQYIDTSSNKMKWNNISLKINEVKVSTDYFKTIGAQLLRGRFFDERYADQHTRSIVINEEAARQMNTANPVGEVLIPEGCDTVPAQIIGVVKNFRVQGANMPVQPAMFMIGNFACSYRSGGAILVKLETANPQNTLAAIEKMWREVEPDFPIRYSFLNDNFQQLFTEYRRVQKVVGAFTVTSLFIALMGLFAMCAFLVKRKAKELGIRKVLGAGTLDVFRTVSARYLWNVAIATAVAIPLGWMAAHKWLQSFAFRYQLSWFDFAVAAILSILVAVLTVGFHVFKAAFTNPVDALRND